jgi:hypothetical protein
MVADLAPAGALQSVLARRIAVAAWRLARADRLEAGLFAERRSDDAILPMGPSSRPFLWGLRPVRVCNPAPYETCGKASAQSRAANSM